MPRLPIDFSKTVIYKIVCNDLSVTELYVGSTTDFIKRKSGHKSKCKSCHLKVYEMIRTNGGWENWSMIEIEKYPCKDNNEARARERHWYEELHASLNMIMPIRNKKEWVEDNKEKLSEYHRDYREANCESLAEYKKKHYEANRESILEYHKEYYETNRESISDYQKEYREKNKEKIAQHKKEYYEKINNEKLNCEWCDKQLSRGSMKYHLKKACILSPENYKFYLKK
tara:strand:- start:241 stop:924 length:684 start_codon:yes stop_codon:yes gene_type:complete